MNSCSERRLPRSFFQRPTVEVAQALLGCVLVRREPGGSRSAVRLVEVEAYLGPGDAACHTAGGRRTERVAAMWGPSGHLYVYLVYGIHHCANVVTAGTDERGVGEAVLLRGAEVVAGAELIDARRPAGPTGRIDLIGPGKLCQGLGLDRRHDGLDLCGGGELWLATDEVGRGGRSVASGPRIGVGFAGEAATWPLRFVLRG